MPDCHSSSCKHIAPKQRTPRQNSALHLYFDLLADELNAAGYPIKQVLSRYKVDLDWDARSVKELIWRPIQTALLDKKSTTELDKQMDINRVYEHVNRFIGEQLGIHVPFPNDPDREAEKHYLNNDAPPSPVEYPEYTEGTAFDEET